MFQSLVSRIRSRRLAAGVIAVVLVAGVAPALADYELGMSYFKQGKYPEAIAEFEAVLANAPEYDFGYYMVGNSYLKLKKYEDAVHNFRKAIEINNQKFAYHLNLAQALLQLKNYSDVVSTLNAAEDLAQAPQHQTLLHQIRGLAHAQLQNYDQAMADLKQANVSGNFAVASTLGRVCKAAGEYDCAIDSFQKALKQESKDEAVLAQLASTHLEMARRGQGGSKKGQYAKAADVAERLVAVDPSPNARELYAASLLGAEKHAQAIDQFQKVVKAEPNNCNAMLNIAQASVPLENWDSTIEWGQKAVRCGKNQHLGYNQVALGYIKLKDWDKALEAAEKSLQVKPTDYARQLKANAENKKETELHNLRMEQLKAQQEAEELAAEKAYQEQLEKQKQYETETGKAGSGQQKDGGGQSD